MAGDEAWRTKRSPPVVCIQKAGFLVLVRDRTQVPSDDLEVSILPDVVLRHLEHSEVEVGDWAEGAAGDEDDRLLVRIPEEAGEAVGWECVIWWI